MLQTKLRGQRRNFAERNINQALSNSKQWWKNIKKLTKQANSTGTINKKRFINEQWMTTPQFLESQNKYYNTLAGNSVIDPPQFATSGQLSPISIGLVKSRHKLIDTSKSNHSHDFPSWISKCYHEDMAPPLTNIISCMLSTLTFPSQWKNAEIVPLPKTSNASVSKDFRPIS